MGKTRKRRWKSGLALLLAAVTAMTPLSGEILADEGKIVMEQTTETEMEAETGLEDGFDDVFEENTEKAEELITEMSEGSEQAEKEEETEQLTENPGETETGTEPQIETGTEAETETSTETGTETGTGKETGRLSFLVLTPGGRVRVTDDSGNVHEAQYSEEGVFLETEAAEGAVFCVEFIADSEEYEASDYRVTLDSGEIINEEKFEAGVSRYETEIKAEVNTSLNVEISFRKIQENDTEESTQTEAALLSEAEAPKVDHVILEVGIIPADAAKYPAALVSGSKSLYTSNKTVTMYDEDGNELGQKIAYCLQPSKNSPPSGSTIPKDKIDELETGTKERTLAKILYYLYGGPAWGKNAADNSGNSMNFKSMLEDIGCSGTGNYAALTHLILAYVYDSSEWNCGIDSMGQPVTPALNTEGQAAVKNLATTIQNMPDPRAEFSASSISSLCQNGKVVSQSVTYYANADNTAKVTLPAGITLVNETDGNKEGTGTVAISGGDRFHLVSEGISGIGNYTFKTTFSTDFSAYKISFSGAQDVGFCYTSGDKELVLTVEWKDAPVPVRVKKISSDSAITENNTMYSLTGAEFEIRNQEGTAVAVLTTDANGDTGQAEIVPGTYVLHESKTPVGYKTSSDISFTVEAGEELKVIEVKDEPKVGKAQILIKKSTDSVSTLPLSDAEFTVSYYDNTAASGTPKRIWVLKTIKDENGDYIAGLSDRCLVSGTFYEKDGEYCIPLGCLTIEETKAPAGYCRDPGIRTVMVSENGENTDVTVADTEFENKPAFGGVAVQKESADQKRTRDGDAVFKNTVFEIINSGGEYVVRKDDLKKAYAPGETVAEIAAGEDGFALLDADADQALQAGATYTIREKTAPEGYKNGDWSCEFTVEEDKVTDLTSSPAVNQVIRGGFYQEKQDLELSETGKTQGDAVLENAHFELINQSASSVKIEGKVYAPNEKIADLYTDREGRIRTAKDYLPYGTYRLTEAEPPRGYTGKGENLDITFEIREEGEIVDLTREGKTVKNSPIRFDITIIKFRDTESPDDAGDDMIPLEGVVFDIYLVSTGEKILSITTDSDGVATTADKAAYPHGRLPYGKYKVVEAVHPDGVRPVSDFYVDGTETGGVYDGKEYKGIYKNDRPVAGYVQIRKTDAETGQIIPTGAEFQILDSSGKVMEFRVMSPHPVIRTNFTTDETGTIALPERLPYGTYYLHEVKAPEGYLTGQDIEFIVTERNDWENVITVDYGDVPAKGKIKITKYDSSTGEKISGAVFGVYAQEDIVTGDGTVRCRKESLAGTLAIGSDGTGMSEELYLGNYYIQELEAPEGYYLDTQKHFVELVYRDQDTPFVIKETEIHNKPVTLKLLKTDPDGEKLDGVEFSVKRLGEPEDAGDDAVAHMGAGTYLTSDGGEMVISYLVPGCYEIKEMTALPGYVLDEIPQYVTVDPQRGIYISDENGRAVDPAGAGADTVILNWENEYTKVDFSKLDVNGDSELPGAEMSVVDHSGNELFHWISTNQPFRISKIPVGEYILIEKTAPEGYALAVEMPFEVTNTGVVQKVVMEDKQVLVSKQDITSGEEIEGAVLTVTDRAGNVIDTWISQKGEKHPISGLKVNETYILREETAPEGYVRAEEAEFFVADDHRIQVVEMKDDYTKVSITKSDITDGKPVIGARLVIKDKDGKEVEEWITESEPHYIEKLPAGEYTLTEITAPDGYEVAESVRFTVEAVAEIQKVEMKDQPVPVSEDTPKTGDEGRPELYLILAAFSAAAVVFLLKRRGVSLKKT